MDHEQLAQKIIHLKNADLALRDQLLQNGQLEQGYHPAMEQLHHKNAVQLNEIIDQIGYPTTAKVGTEASEAAWLIIQHAIGQPVFMKKCCSLLAEAVQKNQANPTHLAYLTDRIAVFENRPQRYGTQFDWDENGEMSPQPYGDLVQVNQRRKAMGWNSLEEQTEIMRRRVKAENQLRPVDLEKRKWEMEQWQKKVGWIS